MDEGMIDGCWAMTKFCNLIASEPGMRAIVMKFISRKVHVFFTYSLVPIRRHGSIIRHSSFIAPYTFPKVLGVTINWISTLSKRGMTFIWIVLLSNKIKSKI